MRVISGKFKGRRLIQFNASHIRPTTDRVKESLFNKLLGEIEGSLVLDLFAGTGNLSIEFLSRGALEVHAVENHSVSLQIIRKNMKVLDICDELKLFKQDVFKFLLSPPTDQPYDIVMADPPFTKKCAHKVMEAIAESRVVCKKSLIIIESSSHERIDDKYLEFYLLDRKGFGDKNVSFFKNKNVD